MSYKRLLIFLLGLAALVPAGLGYTAVMARIGSGTPPALLAPVMQADRIVVSKADRRMYLLRGDGVLRAYDIAMGANRGAGPKQREGDERTPEGAYLIDWRNPRSVAHLSLHISYPDAADRARAAAAGHDPGGNIMIHGLPNGWGALGGLHRLLDWTDGCVAVTNAEMREIWSMVPNGTPIVIHEAWYPPEGTH